jgi:hypothetical protein
MAPVEYLGSEPPAEIAHPHTPTRAPRAPGPVEAWGRVEDAEHDPAQALTLRVALLAASAIATGAVAAWLMWLSGAFR